MIRKAPKGHSRKPIRFGRITLGIAGFLMALTSVPYLILYFSTPLAPHSVYDWILPPYPEDGLAYLAWVKQAASGAILFKVQYSAIAQPALIFQPFFLVAGWLSALTHLSAGVILFWMRLAGILLFVHLLVRFLRDLELPPHLVWGACALVCLTTGMGGFFASPDFNPADLWVVDLNPLWSLTWNPLFPVALSLQLGIAILARRAVREADRNRRRNQLLLCGGLTGLLVLIHPYDVVIVLVILVSFAWTHLKDIRLADVATLAALSVPAVAYQFFLSLYHPVLSLHSQSRMDSPSLSAYLAGITPLIFIAMLGAIAARQEGHFREFLPLVSWIVLAFLLAYAPFWFQRKMILGVYIPIGILAALGCREISRISARRQHRLFWLLVGGLVAISIKTHYANFDSARTEVQNDPIAYYQPESLLEAARTLERISRKDEAVLSSIAVMRLIPGLSGNAVLLGHWAQAVKSEEYLSELNLILLESASDREERAKERLLLLPIRYVLIDAELLRGFGGKTPSWLRAITDTVYDREPDVLLLRIRGPA